MVLWNEGGLVMHYDRIADTTRRYEPYSVEQIKEDCDGMDTIRPIHITVTRYQQDIRFLLSAIEEQKAKVKT